MQEKVEKYIYYIRENKYRVKFLKVDKKNNFRINFDQYIIGTLDDARKLRDDKLKENGLNLEQKKDQEDIFAINDDDSVKKNEKAKKKSRKNSKGKDGTKVDKYIYEISKGKKYRIFIRKGGSNGQKGDYYSTIFNGTLSQAKKERDAHLESLKLKNGKGNKGSIKFIDFVRVYFKEYAIPELSPTTVKDDKTALRNYVLPEIANMQLNKIDVLVIQRIINNLKERDRQRPDKDGNIIKLSGSSVNNVYRLLRKILNKAVSWDFISENPVLKVKTPGIDKKEKNSYNREQLIEVLDILKSTDIKTETMFNIVICTGLRREELLGLHIDDIDFDNNFIYVKRAVIWDDEKKEIVEHVTKTKDSVRKMPIPVFCSEIIKEYLKMRDKTIQLFKKKNKNYIPINNLFLGKYGGLMHPDTPSQKWLKFRRKNNHLTDVTLHGLRHSYCTMQMNENPNLSPADVQKLMGHSQLTTTFVYTHANEDKSQDAISVFDKYYSFNGEIKVNFNQMLSLYSGINFAPKREIEEIMKFILNSALDNDKSNSLIKNYIDNRYPIFKKIDISKINLYNVWDILDLYKKKYGDEFILTPIIS